MSGARRRVPVVLLAAALATAGCGLRAPHEAVVRAAQAGAGSSATGAGSPPAGARQVPEGGPGGSATTVEEVAGSSDAGGVTAAAGPTGSPSATGSHPISPDRTGAGAEPGSKGAGTVPTVAAGNAPGGAGERATPEGSTRPVPAGTPGGPGPATPAGEGKKAPIVFGSIGWLSGPVGALTKATVEAVQVWTQWTNDQGGIAGHRLVHLIGDDGGDPARHQAIAQEFVEKRGAIAFVMNPEDTVGRSAADYPTKKRIPVISTIGGDAYVYDSPMYFATVPTGPQNAFAMAGGFAQVAIPQGKKKLGVIACAEVANVCKGFADMWSSPKMRKLGFEPVYSATASLVQPDYTSECLGARQAGVEMLAIGMDNNSVARIAASCHRQGYRPIIGFSNQVSVNSMLDDPELEGAVAGSNTFAWPAADTPARREFHAVFARYRPGKAPGGSNAVGWVAAKAFETALLKFGVPDQPTSAALLEGLWSLAGDTLGGLSYPLPFNRGKPSTPKACWAAVVIEGKAWTAPFGGDMQCES